MILSVEQYKEEINRILSDGDTYQILSADPSRSFRKKLETIIQYGVDHKLLSKQEAKYFIPTASRIPVIYYPPGRPIISGIELLTSRLGEYIDLHLQPLVKNMQAYLKDTKHTLQLLKERVGGTDVIMATGDVDSLNTIVDHEGALDAVGWALDNGEDTVEVNMRNFILKCLEFCLQHHFSGITTHSIYKQKA